MSDRAIFPDLQLFKKTVVERFLVAARAVYSNHPIYRYDEFSVADTKIHIEPTYANQTFEGKSPRLLIKVGQYEFSLQDMLGGNLMADVLNSEGVIGGYSSIKNMTTMITVVVRAYAEEESSDLADELVLLGAYAAHHMFSQVGLNIRGSAVSETRETDSQNDTFDTLVNFTVDVPWELKKYSGKLPSTAEPEIEIPGEPIEGYKAPGVYVVNGKFI